MKLTKFGDAGVLVLIENNKNLANLDLGGTGVGDASAAKLSELKSLGTLDLSGTKITDKTGKEFEKFAALGRLDLSNTAISSQSYDSIINLNEHLRTLNLTGTRLVQAKLNTLKTGMPYTIVTP